MSGPGSAPEQRPDGVAPATAPMAAHANADVNAPARRWAVAWLLVAVAALVVFPFLVPDPFSQQVVVMMLMYGALGAAWNLVGGFLGRVSFGHAEIGRAH